MITKCKSCRRFIDGKNYPKWMHVEMGCFSDKKEKIEVVEEITPLKSPAEEWWDSRPKSTTSTKTWDEY